jgi:hypothetical protein
MKTSLISLVALTTFGCASKQQSVDAAVAAALAAQKKVEAPAVSSEKQIAKAVANGNWVDEPPVGCQAGVGPLLANEGTAKDVAIADGRAKLEKELKAQVKNFLDDTYNALIAEGKTVESQEIRELTVEQLGLDGNFVESTGVRARKYKRDSHMRALVCIDESSLANRIAEEGKLSPAAQEQVRGDLKNQRDEMLGR